MMYVPLDGKLSRIRALVPPPLLLSWASTVPPELIRYRGGGVHLYGYLLAGCSGE